MTISQMRHYPLSLNILSFYKIPFSGDYVWYQRVCSINLYSYGLYSYGLLNRHVKKIAGVSLIAWVVRSVAVICIGSM